MANQAGLAVQARKARIETQLDELKALLARVPAGATADWGHVGTVGKIETVLYELLRFARSGS